MSLALFAKASAAVGFVTVRMLLDRTFAGSVDEAVFALIGGVDTRFVPERPRMVLLVGFSGSGKSTLARGCPQFSRMTCIDTDVIHRELRRRFPRFRKDVIGSMAYWELQALTSVVRKRMIRKAIEERRSILIDACNLTSRARAERLMLAKEAGYATSIVSVHLPEDELLGRLKTRDAEYVRQGRHPTYVAQYYEVQMPTFETPEEGEADSLHYFPGNTSPKRFALP